MVMNDKASLAFGDSNMIRHNEVETLESSDNSKARLKTYSLMHIDLLVSIKPEFDRPIALSFSDRGGFKTFRIAGISIL